MIDRQDSPQPKALRRQSNGVTNGRRRPSSKGQQAKVIVSSTYWRPWDDLDVAEWIALGRRLGTVGRGVAWWIGDWVNYGNMNFGQKYSRAATVTGYDVQSLMNMSYVASRFDSSRRREKLSWSHHAELAGLAIEHQEMWLEHAERRNYSVRGLREALRTWRANQPGARNTGQSQPHTGRTNDDSRIGAEDGEAVCPQCGYRMEAEDDRG